MRLGDRFGQTARRCRAAAALVAALAAAHCAGERVSSRPPTTARSSDIPATAATPPPAHDERAVVEGPPAGASAGPEEPAIDLLARPILLEISVRIACDEEFRRGTDWAQHARQRVAEASEVFEKRFGIRWRVRDIEPWKSYEDAPTLGDVLDEMIRDVPRSGADVVLGFSGQTHASGAMREYEQVGWARLLGTAAVVRSSGRDWSSKWRCGALVHELGHLLGAWHCAQKTSVMFEGGERLVSDEFDEQSAAMIEMVRDAGFPRGVGWIDDARAARIREVYRAGHAPDELPPTVAFALWRGEQALAAPADRAEACREFRAALAEQEACVGAEDESLVKCLMALARADRLGDAAEQAEAVRLEDRALDIGAAKNREKRQNKPRDERASPVPK